MGARSGEALLADVAAKTRIPQRHLEAIERDDFNALPSTTYSVGFARAFARTVGADEVAVAALVRSQLEQGGRERWIRHFGPHRFWSWFSIRGGLLYERFGLLRFGFELPCDESALRMRLVDRLGSLQDAIATAARMAQLTDYGLREYPESVNWLEAILNRKKEEPTALIREQLGDENFRVFEQVKKIKSMTGSVQARLPFEIIIK